MKITKKNYDKIIKIPLYTKPLKFNSKRHLNHCTVQNKLKSKKIPLTQAKCFSTVQQKLERVKFTSFNSIMTTVSHKKIMLPIMYISCFFFFG
jgi:superoxide dismutase